WPELDSRRHHYARPGQQRRPPRPGRTMKRAGTSLIELMIALVVLAAFASTMTLLIINNSKSDESNDARREARGVARSAITILESELRMAEPNGVITPIDDSTITYRQ